MSILKNKSILITAGPTWVRLDSVRVISNIATGQTGILLAKAAFKQGAKVTLFLGPVGPLQLCRCGRVVRYHYFDELLKKITKELRARKYDLIIHSAAVSDFKPKNVSFKKISSGKKHVLILVPLPKIVSKIRSLATYSRLVMFKLEPGVNDQVLIKRAKIASNKIGADFIVANRIDPYRAYIIDKTGNKVLAKNKISLVKELLRVLAKGRAGMNPALPRKQKKQ